MIRRKVLNEKFKVWNMFIFCNICNIFLEIKVRKHHKLPLPSKIAMVRVKAWEL